MKTSARMVAVATIVAVGAVSSAGAGASVASKAKEVSNEKFAKVTCGVFGGIMADVDDFTAAYQATSDDPVAFHGEAVELTNGLLDEIAGYSKRMTKVYPDVDGGKTIAKTFVMSVAEIEGEISGALEKFQAADPTGVAFQADVTLFETSINLLDVNISDPFGSVRDQKLLGAFDDEKSCAEVVTIYGG